MKSIPTLFIATAGIFALCGMLWGIQMSVTQDHSLSPGHGHLNLIGFVMMSVFGTYYALTPKAAASRLAKFHFAWMVLAVVTIVPGIVLAISAEMEALAKVGSIISVLGVVLFIFMVFRHGVGSAEPQN